MWETNSIQDAALFVIVNLAASPASRPYLRELDAVKQLSSIAEYPEENWDLSENEAKQLGFQCLKAVSCCCVVYSIVCWSFASLLKNCYGVVFNTENGIVLSPWFGREFWSTSYEIFFGIFEFE